MLGVHVHYKTLYNSCLLKPYKHLQLINYQPQDIKCSSKYKYFFLSAMKLKDCFINAGFMFYDTLSDDYGNKYFCSIIL